MVVPIGSILASIRAKKDRLEKLTLSYHDPKIIKAAITQLVGIIT